MIGVCSFLLYGQAQVKSDARKMGLCRKLCEMYGGSGGGCIRILSPPVPFVFCFETAGHLMDAAGRAVGSLTVLSSAAGRIGSCFFLCVTVRFSERIAARGLFSEYGRYIGAGEYLAAYIMEQAEKHIPDAVARIGDAIKN